MLDIRNVSIINKKDVRDIIKNFNLTLNEGDKAVIIGEEGNGKSTLLKFIYKPELIDTYCEYTGNTMGNCNVGYLEQEMDEYWFDKSVEEFFADVDIYGCKNSSIWSMNLNPELLISKQKIETLSGGEKVKIRLIKLLANEPDILLLDEPTNDLDISTLKWLETFINQSKLPILFVSHDETLIENTANVIIHLEQIKRKTEPKYTIERMGYRDYVNKRLHGIHKQEMIANKQREDYKHKLERWQQIYNKVESRQNSISRQNPSGGRLLKKKIKNLKSQQKRLEKDVEQFVDRPDVEEAILYGFPGETSLPNGKTVIELTIDKLITNHGKEEKILANDILLRVIGPERVAIIGDNGTGKTTLMREIAKILCERTDINASYMPQNYEELLDYEMLPADFLAPSGQKDEVTKAFTYMGGMNFTRDEMEHRIGDLSGGQKAKLILLRMILNGCNVLLLDEPTRNLSPLSNPVIREVLSDFEGAIISVTHDRKYIQEVATAVYELTTSGLIKRD